MLIALLHLLIRAYAIFIFATTAERRSCVEWKTENPHPLGECGTIGENLRQVLRAALSR